MKFRFTATALLTVALALASAPADAACFGRFFCWRPFAAWRACRQYDRAAGPRYCGACCNSYRPTRPASCCPTCPGGTCPTTRSYCPTCPNGACRTVVPSACAPGNASDELDRYLDEPLSFEDQTRRLFEDAVNKSNASGEFAPGSQQTKTNDPDLNMLAAANAVRAQFGLPAFALDRRMCERARGCVSRCAWRGALAHEGTEILAQNYAGFQQALSQWAGSPDHSRWLFSNYRRVGVAQVVDRYGRFWCAISFN